MELDGTTDSSRSFTGPIGKLDGCISESLIAKFKNIPDFPGIPQLVFDELGSDQHYANRICMPVIFDSVNKNLQFLEVGSVVHSRWLAPATRFCCYVSKDTACANFQAIAKLCFSVYFPTSLETKKTESK